MTNKQKVKGSTWERQAVDILENLIEGSVWKKMPTSGAMGTTLNEPSLMGDLVGRVPGFPPKFKVECKVGYNASPNREIKSFTLKKEWLDKVAEEAEHNGDMPVVMGKFDNVHSGIRNFIVLDTKVFAQIMNYISDLAKELDRSYEEIEKLNKK